MLQAGESLGERAETKGLLGAGAEPRVPYGGLVRVGEVSGRRTRNLKAFGPEGFFWGGEGRFGVSGPVGGAFGCTFYGRGVFGWLG